MLVSHAKIALANDILSSPLPYLFAVVYVHYGAIGAMALGLPLLAVRQLYKTNWQLEKVNQELLQLMVAAIEARDPYTSGHSRRVARNARIIARALGLNSRDVERVAVAALLHDVGKIYEVFAPILRKPGKLTPDERLTMESHPIKSAELVKNVSHLQDVVVAIRNHHENWDGSGYPDGLHGEQIPLWSRIIMIADTVDAMTTDRPYRAAMTEADVRAELIKLRGKQFDPGMCDGLLRSALYPSLFEKQDGGSTQANIQLWRADHPAERVAIEA
jgi:putative nucleotidyltransferase with HDIG domain